MHVSVFRYMWVQVFCIGYVYNICGYVCTYACMHACIYAYTHVNCVYTCVYVYIRVSSWVGLRVARFQTRPCDPNSVTGDLFWCSLWTRYTGDSKTDSWDDPEISTGPCSENQMAIQIQNHVISRECLFIDLF